MDAIRTFAPRSHLVDMVITTMTMTCGEAEVPHNGAMMTMMTGALPLILGLLHRQILGALPLTFGVLPRRIHGEAAPSNGVTGVQDGVAMDILPSRLHFRQH